MVSGSLVYHTKDSTNSIMETGTATPSGGGDSQCSGPWVDDPTCQLDSWPRPWFPSGLAVLGYDFTPDGSPDFVARLYSISQLEQAIIIPDKGD